MLGRMDGEDETRTSSADHQSSASDGQEGDYLHRCVDGMEIVWAGNFWLERTGDGPDKKEHVIARNSVLYLSCNGKRRRVQLFVSGTELSRDMSLVVREHFGAATATFPNTARRVQNDAFRKRPLRSVVLNEGLDTLGECDDKAIYPDGVF